MLTHVDDSFNNSTATVNVIDYVNVKSDQLTYFTDLLFSEKDNDSKFGYRSQFNYQPSNFSYISGSVLYFDKNFQLNDFGYLRRADWIHVGLGGGLKQINFAEQSQPINQIDMSVDFNYDSDTKGNSNPIRIDQKMKSPLKTHQNLSLILVLKPQGKIQQ
jgi:2-polyprenyl-3-methyl-5-hydroxy-6-metoxy-1,4-benzoquinol methylase